MRMNNRGPRGIGLLAALATGLLVMLAAPASATGHTSGTAIADNNSVASGTADARNNSTASGDAIARDGSVSSGCAEAHNHSTASGGLCPAPEAKQVHEVTKAAKPTAKALRQAAAARPTRVDRLAFTGPKVAPLVATAAGLFLGGALLMMLGSERRRTSTT